MVTFPAAVTRADGDDVGGVVERLPEAAGREDDAVAAVEAGNLARLDIVVYWLCVFQEFRHHVMANIVDQLQPTVSHTRSRFTEGPKRAIATGNAEADTRTDDRVADTIGDGIICPICETRNDPGYRYCRECVSELPTGLLVTAGSVGGKADVCRKRLSQSWKPTTPIQNRWRFRCGW